MMLSSRGLALSVVLFTLADIGILYVAGDACTEFTTSTVFSDESATLKFSLSESCPREANPTYVVVSVKNQSPGAFVEDVCQISSAHWLKESVSQCILDVKLGKYSVTRKLVEPRRKEEVILTARFAGGTSVAASVILQLPGTVSAVSQASWIFTSVIVDKMPKTTAKSKQDASQGQGVTSSNEVATSPEDDEVNREARDDISSFVQTPAFGFVLMGTVIAVVVILLVVLSLKIKGNCSPAVRRARNSLVIPDNYEHPTGSHHYERPTLRGRQQQPLPPPPPPSNPADVNRDSLPDPNYALIDDVMVSSGQYEIPVPMAPNMPDGGASIQAETNV